MSSYQILIACPNKSCKHITHTTMHAISLESAQDTALLMNENSKKKCPYCGLILSYFPIELENEL